MVALFLKGEEGEEGGFISRWVTKMMNQSMNEMYIIRMNMKLE